MIYIMYSDDYEVFLGGNYALEKDIVIESTDRVLSTCESVNVPMTLFCDLLSIWRYRELGYDDFPNLVDLQLKAAVKKGHDVQAHIHPHWLETKIVKDTQGFSRYEFDLSKFLIGNWYPGDQASLEQFCSDLFKRSKQYLENLLRPIVPGYYCIAYRAGGYGIQPNTKEIIKALVNNGYLIDSSIVPGMVLSSNVNRIDFLKVPDKGNYFLSPEHGLDQVENNGIFEVPLVTLRYGKDRWTIAKNFPSRVATYLRNAYTSSSKDQGYGIQSTEKGSGLRLIFRELDRLVHPFWQLELRADATVQMMLDAVKNYVKMYHNQQTDLFFAFSIHSKHMHPNILNKLGEFHIRLQRLYGNQLKAITYQEAARIKKLGVPGL